MFFRGCVNIVAQSFSQLCRTKTADVSRILGALGAPSTTGTDLQAFTSLLLLISPHYFVIVIQAHSSLSRTVQGRNSFQRLIFLFQSFYAKLPRQIKFTTNHFKLFIRFPTSAYLQNNLQICN